MTIDKQFTVFLALILIDMFIKKATDQMNTHIANINAHKATTLAGFWTDFRVWSIYVQFI